MTHRISHALIMRVWQEYNDQYGTAGSLWGIPSDDWKSRAELLGGK